MSSYNSYTYYTRFLRCLERYLEKFVNEKKKLNEIHKWKDDPKILFKYEDKTKKMVGVTAGVIEESFEYVFDKLIKKAPSACMGADDWLDKFFNSVVYEGFCTETWCGHERCEKHSNRYPYNCSEDFLPSKCEKWKAWRLGWRSYPDNEACQKCRFYKPEPNIDPRFRTDLQTKKINEYKCYCRAKELPEGCPKKTKGNQNGKKLARLDGRKRGDKT